MAAFATSYIPSFASQVTRAADNASMIGNNFARWYNVNEGTLFEDAVFSGRNTAGYGYYTAFLQETGGVANIIALTSDAGGAATRIRAENSESAILNMSPVVLLSGPVKSAVALQTNNFRLAVNGGLSAADTAGVVPTVTRFELKASVAGASPVLRCIRKIAYYPRRLSDTELQIITS
jgi:hypothetical protein